MFDDVKLNIDGITSPKLINRTATERISTNEYKFSWADISPGVVSLQANARQRIWFLTALRTSTTGEINLSTPYNINSVLVYKNQQYLSMRGDR